jgi:uncharacterized protein (TIGR00730 family)
MKKTKRPVKAYKNLEFLNSPEARTIRVLCEFIEPWKRFRQYRVSDTIVFFGSSRSVSLEKAEARLRTARERLREGKGDREALKTALRRAERHRYMARAGEDATALARDLTRWSLSLHKTHRRFIICTGGGPGIMEAANKGAQLAGGKSVGLNISIPLEQAPNRYISDELNFEFHYFFVRKFWFIYLAKAVVIFPGGFGTMDELMEVLTLIQTQKIKKKMPVVLYGSEFWRDIVNFDALVDYGTISPEDLDLFRICDTPDEAFRFLKEKLSLYYLKRRKGKK